MGLDGIPVSGQDGDHAALNRVALGTQTVSVWKDSRELAVWPVKWRPRWPRHRDGRHPGSRCFATPAATMNSILIAPVPVTRRTVGRRRRRLIPLDVLCQGVTASHPCRDLQTMIA